MSICAQCQNTGHKWDDPTTPCLCGCKPKKMTTPDKRDEFFFNEPVVQTSHPTVVTYGQIEEYEALKRKADMADEIMKVYNAYHTEYSMKWRDVTNMIEEILKRYRGVNGNQ